MFLPIPQLTRQNKIRFEKALAENAERFELKPFYPNPGSQEQLFFEILGCKKGEPTKIIDYGDGAKAIAYPVVPTPYEGKSDFICYTAGNGTGKSRLGAATCVLRSITYPNTKGLITANDYPQLESSTLVALAEFCRDQQVPLKPSKPTPEETASTIAKIRHCWINGQFHYVLSAKAFLGETAKATQSGRGFTVGHIWADEWLRLPSASAFNTALTRLRAKGCKTLGIITSTINTDNPYGWDYEIFESSDRSPEAKKLFISLTGSTFENRHNLDSGYIPRLQASLTPELFQIEVLGQRVQITVGKIIKYFNREKHCVSPQIACYETGCDLHVSFDFNHDPSTAIAAIDLEGEIFIIKEWFLRNANTFESSEAVALWVKELGLRRVYLHGDASGEQKTANSTMSNWQIVKRAFDNLSIEWIQCYKRANPEVSPTINLVNSLFFQNGLYLNQNCIELRKDLETLQYDKNGNIDKKSDSLRSHLFDNLRYLCYDLRIQSPAWVNEAKIRL